LIQANALVEIYDKPGTEILKEFKLVAGNSGGSIVIAALL
jgi:patatin-like phospholipase/acyl hydrolase